MGFKKAAKEFGVPRTTLKRRHLGKIQTATGPLKQFGGFRKVLTDDMERSLAHYIITMEEMMFGIGPLEVRRLAFQLGEMNGLKHLFRNGKAGPD